MNKGFTLFLGALFLGMSFLMGLARLSITIPLRYLFILAIIGLCLIFFGFDLKLFKVIKKEVTTAYENRPK